MRQLLLAVRVADVGGNLHLVYVHPDANLVSQHFRELRAFMGPAYAPLHGRFREAACESRQVATLRRLQHRHLGAGLERGRERNFGRERTSGCAGSGGAGSGYSGSTSGSASVSTSDITLNAIVEP